MKLSIEKLGAGLQEIIETQGRSSNAKIIRGLFDRITEAMEEGITLDMLVDYLHQNEILITKNSLRNTLYRIRKERGNEPNSKPSQTISKENHVSPTPPISSSNSKETTETKINPYDLMMEKYKQCNNQVDKYIALGGKREDIEEQNISTQRGMVMTLRNQLRQKYKGIY
ncbi:hypothetical protein ABF107_004435 [Vibrio parahaemolyticus]|uniref:hypothetical protein n=1 Tax=Vibrio parahaemolyticus TaxID=670 RepID=UPI000B21601F|nr:hypothetical protein [Vibrio parahaemolyticus]EGQ8084058.1 hypothetical protein [Vibrio parahaemolyticus]